MNTAERTYSRAEIAAIRATFHPTTLDDMPVGTRVLVTSRGGRKYPEGMYAIVEAVHPDRTECMGSATPNGYAALQFENGGFGFNRPDQCRPA